MISVNRDIVFGGLFVLAIISLIFSVEFPISGLGSEYASINGIDFIVVAICLALVADNAAGNDWQFQLTMPRVTLALTIVSVWIIITIIVASMRSSSSIFLSGLWTVKWFEVLVLFLFAQNYLNRQRGNWVVQSVFISGFLLVLASIYAYQFGDIRRLRLFFNNPNTLSIFFNLMIIMGVAFLISWDGVYRVFPAIAVPISGLALLWTGSRSGIIGLIAGILILLVLYSRDIPWYGWGIMLIGAIMSTLLAPHLLPQTLLTRFTEWVRIEDGAPVLTQSSAAQSFRRRIELIDRALDLFMSQPIFGYGWYASPSRVGYLDIHYTTLLVEVGLIGFFLFSILYFEIYRGWLQIRRSTPVGTAGAAWFVSILAASVGGNFVRIPQIMFLFLLLLAAGNAMTNKNIHPKKGASDL